MPAGTNPTQNQIFVRPNVYEPGRANITVFNWQDLQAVSVDVSSAGLSVGQAFEVVDTQNFFGGPILTGVYTGGVISLPMTGTAVAQPVGDAPFPAVHTGIGYGSFVLLPITTNPAGTGTTLTSSPSPSVFGQAVTFTATVAAAVSGAGTPGGTVSFMDGATALGSGMLNASGKATLTTSALAVGSHGVTAVYGGNGSFVGSTSPALTQLVNPAGTRTTLTTLTSSLNPSVFGQAVTFTATVAAAVSGAGTPGGTVSFMDGATALGSGVLNASGNATFTTSALAVGSHGVTAVYGGNGSFVGSTSPALTQLVNPAGTGTTLTSSPSPSVFGQAVTFTATVAAAVSGAGTPGGTVSLGFFAFSPGKV